MAISNILPDPNNPINAAGEYDAGGTPGPGYASVRLSSIEPIMRDRTNSQRLVTRGVAGHRWEISINYNPMTREEFDPIYTFLLYRRGGIRPFFVSLPQYTLPKDSALVTDPTTTSPVVAGESVIPYTVAAGTPTMGDLFTISDPSDSAHTKAYMVIGVSAGNIITNTPVARDISNGSTLTFIDPFIRVVISGDVQEYNLGTENLFSFSLKLEEAQI